uniref:Uncharacterized protein n=1 Tax=Rhizophora mucronata TaxID=61149 RepID=A0A2P2M0M4_RHIMU
MSTRPTYFNCVIDSTFHSIKICPSHKIQVNQKQGY